jgi:hypothetical protein
VKGLFLALGYLGTAMTAIATMKAVARLVTGSASLSPRLPTNPLTFQTLWRLVKHVYREEVIIIGIFALSLIGLIAKYFADWDGLPGYFLEFINLLCIINFWIHFRLTDLGPKPRSTA